MSTIIISNQHYKKFPLVIAANHDDANNRKLTSVRVLSDGIIGSSDDNDDTYLATNNNSLFAAITRQGEQNQKKISIGKIITEALKAKSLDELLSFVEDIDPSKYNRFNIIFGNQKKVFIAHSYLLHSMVVRDVSVGISVVSNNIKFVGEDKKATLVHTILDGHIGDEWPEYYKRIKNTLSTEGIRIKKKKKDIVNDIYTKSSTVLAFSDEGLARYKFYNRTIIMPVKKEGDSFLSKYVDYIDLWKDPKIFKDRVVPVVDEAKKNVSAPKKKDYLGMYDSYADEYYRKFGR
jgi:hypothetical protein